jgi:hypothetical protein
VWTVLRPWLQFPSAERTGNWHPSAYQFRLLKFDILNKNASRLTDVAMRVSFVDKTLNQTDQVEPPPPRVVVGPVTIRVEEPFQAESVLRSANVVPSPLV